MSGILRIVSLLFPPLAILLAIGGLLTLMAKFGRLAISLPLGLLGFVHYLLLATLPPLLKPEIFGWNNWWAVGQNKEGVNFGGQNTPITTQVSHGNTVPLKNPVSREAREAWLPIPAFSSDQSARSSNPGFQSARRFPARSFLIGRAPPTPILYDAASGR